MRDEDQDRRNDMNQEEREVYLHNMRNTDQYRTNYNNPVGRESISTEYEHRDHDRRNDMS